MRLYEYSPWRQAMLRSRFECMFSVTLLRGGDSAAGQGALPDSAERQLRGNHGEAKDAGVSD
jgi:hypothetical protein